MEIKMPIYLFKNPKTGKIKEVIQKMTERHVYLENGVEWERIFTSPAGFVDGKMNCPPDKKHRKDVI